MTNSWPAPDGTRWNLLLPPAIQLRPSPRTRSTVAANTLAFSPVSFSTATWNLRSVPAVPRVLPGPVAYAKVPGPVRGTVAGSTATAGSTLLGPGAGCTPLEAAFDGAADRAGSEA